LGPDLRVVSWLHGDRLRLVCNDTYFGGEPRIAAIDLRFIPDSAAIIEQLRTHEVDASFFADPTYLAQYGDLPDTRIERVRLSGFGDLIFNTQRRDLADPRVRRAIAMQSTFHGSYAMRRAARRAPPTLGAGYLDGLTIPGSGYQSPIYVQHLSSLNEPAGGMQATGC